MKRLPSFQELIEDIKWQINDWKELCAKALAEVKDAPEALEIVSQSHEIERDDLTQLIEQIAGQCSLDETQREELENLRQLLKK